MLLLKALALALSLAIDVFAVSIGIGIKQVDVQARLRFALAFVSAELLMTAIGAAAGRAVFFFTCGIAGYLGFIALIGVGIFVVKESFEEEKKQLDLSQGFGLFVSALAISIDSLGVGFSIPFIGVPLGLMIGMIAICTIAASLLGFSFGKRLGEVFEHRAELAAGVALILTGVVFCILKATGVG